MRTAAWGAVCVFVAACGGHERPAPFHAPASGGAAGSGGTVGGGAAGSSGGVAAAAGFVGFPSCDFAELQVGGVDCALATDGSVACWGGYWGELGNGQYWPSTLPVPVLELVDAQSIGGGNAHTCAARANGTVVCWGKNSGGQLGSGDPTQYSYVPLEVPTLTDVTAIAKGSAQSQTCVLRANGRIACWGDDSPVALAGTPVDLVGIFDAVNVAVSDHHGCAVRANGQVSCWGHTAGAVGLGFQDSQIYVTPQTVVGLDGAVQVAVGNYFACALRSQGDIWCWGHGHLGQLGGGVFVDEQLTPAPVVGLSDAVQVSASDTGVCALRQTGAVMCWGRNPPIATDGDTGVSVPVPVPDIYDAVAIGVGTLTSCAISQSRGVLCWGMGYLGDGTLRTSEVPAALACGAGCGGTDPKQVLDSFMQCDAGVIVQTKSSPGLTCARACCSLGFESCYGMWLYGSSGCTAESASASASECGAVFDADSRSACQCFNWKP